MPFIKVGSVSELAPDSIKEVMVGENAYAICNVGGRVYALSGICLHRGGPLGQGALHGHSVVCPWHAWEWDCRTGANGFDPATKVPTYEVKIEGGDILLEIP